MVDRFWKTQFNVSIQNLKYNDERHVFYIGKFVFFPVVNKLYFGSLGWLNTI